MFFCLNPQLFKSACVLDPLLPNPGHQQIAENLYTIMKPVLA